MHRLCHQLLPQKSYQLIMVLCQCLLLQVYTGHGYFCDDFSVNWFQSSCVFCFFVFPSLLNIQYQLQHLQGMWHQFHQSSTQVHQKLHHQALIKEMRQIIRFPYQSQMLQVHIGYCYDITTSQILVLSRMLYFKIQHLFHHRRWYRDQIHL